MNRLEEIKSRYIDYETDFNIHSEDVEWLIKQVERVKKLEEIKSDAINQIDATQRRNKRLEKRVQELEEGMERFQSGRNVAVATKMKMDDLEKQNKRYREVVTQAISDLENECLWDALVKLKALEADEQ